MTYNYSTNAYYAIITLLLLILYLIDPVLLAYISTKSMDRLTPPWNQ
jgi:hypothetical protein